MCEAYAAERSYIVYMEGIEILKGFKAAAERKSRSANPNNKKFQKYYYEAWSHGWGCFHERLIPHILEMKYREYFEEAFKGNRWYDHPNGHALMEKMERNFKRTGKLDPILKRFLI